MEFPFAFDPQYRIPLMLLGATPRTCGVTITDTEFVARFGAFRCRTPLGNIWCVQQSGPYLAVKAIGARGSLADRGATFGTTTAGGVCVQFTEPVQILDPTGRILHPGLTVTVADRDGLEAVIRQRCPLREA